MEQLLDASRDSSFDCIVFPNYCNSHNSVVCSLSCGYNRFPLVEHDPRYTLIVRDILYWETARSLWTQYLKAIPGKEEKVKRAIRGILADYEKEERDIIYLESKNHCVLVHLDGIRQTPEGSPSFYATLDEAEHEFASSAFLCHSKDRNPMYPRIITTHGRFCGSTGMSYGIWKYPISICKRNSRLSTGYPRMHCLWTARSTRAATGWKTMPAPWSAAKR